MPLTPYRRASSASGQPPGALPRRLRRATLVVIGCGDVGLRLIAQRIGGPDRLRIIATARRADQLEAIRQLGAIPFACNLDDRHSLSRLAALPNRLIHLAPPPNIGDDDRRTRLLTALYGRITTQRRLSGQPPARWAYISTTGVYGDCQGAKIDESHTLRPSNPRSARRVAAEQTMLHASPTLGVAVSLTFRLLTVVLNLSGGIFLLLPGGSEVWAQMEDAQGSTEKSENPSAESPPR
ncbi:MAG: hypothetical protein ACKO8O_02270 [Betaproteobacteria bacterium]